MLITLLGFFIATASANSEPSKNYGGIRSQLGKDFVINSCRIRVRQYLCEVGENQLSFYLRDIPSILGKGGRWQS